MTPSWPRIAHFVIAFGIAGCASEPADGDGGGGDDHGARGGAGGEASGAPARRCPEGPGAPSDTEAVLVGQVSAQVVDERGEPASPGLVQVCAKNVCYDVSVGASGALAKQVDEEMNAPACKFGDGRSWGKLAIPFGGGDTDLGTLTAVALPDFADGVALVAGESATSGGVTLTLTDDAVIEVDDLSYEDESEWGFRAAALSGDALSQLGQDFVLGYALAPLETRICPSPALSLENSLDLPAGTELELFSHGLDVSEEWAAYGGWQKVGEGAVSDDGATLEFAEGPPVLTALGVREKRR